MVSHFYGVRGRGALHSLRSNAVRHCGDYGKENVGISNDNAGENPARRKTKDSSAMLVS